MEVLTLPNLRRHRPPVFVTPDEVGAHWQDGKLHLPLHNKLNGAWLVAPEARGDMNFGFDILVAHAARTRRLVAGSIVGYGTISNRDPKAGVCTPKSAVRQPNGCLSRSTARG